MYTAENAGPIFGPLIMCALDLDMFAYGFACTLEHLSHEAHLDSLDAADRIDLLSDMLPGASFLEAVPCEVFGKA